MKEFEKWDKKVKVKTWSGNMMERRERKWYREQTWRAALEWAIAKLEPDLEDWEQDFLDEIREELEDETNK